MTRNRRSSNTSNRSPIVCKGSFSLQPSISKSYTVSQQVRP
nr:MAG TPA: hypothetical protein [Caudoviricetes sp.]